MTKTYIDASPGASKIAGSQLTVVPSTTWNLHSTNQNFAQLETERLSISPVLQNKELIAQCGKQYELQGTVNRVLQQVL